MFATASLRVQAMAVGMPQNKTPPSNRARLTWRRGCLPFPKTRGFPNAPTSRWGRLGKFYKNVQKTRISVKPDAPGRWALPAAFMLAMDRVLATAPHIPERKSID